MSWAHKIGMNNPQSMMRIERSLKNLLFQGFPPAEGTWPPFCLGGSLMVTVLPELFPAGLLFAFASPPLDGVTGFVAAPFWGAVSFAIPLETGFCCLLTPPFCIGSWWKMKINSSTEVQSIAVFWNYVQFVIIVQLHSKLVMQCTTICYWCQGHIYGSQKLKRK